MMTKTLYKVNVNPLGNVNQLNYNNTTLLGSEMSPTKTEINTALMKQMSTRTEEESPTKPMSVNSNPHPMNEFTIDANM